MSIMTEISQFIDKFYGNIIAGGRWEMLQKGTILTLQISLGAILLGIFIGFVISFMRLSGSKVLDLIAKVYIDIIRGTPTVTQLLIINFTIFASARDAGVWIGIVAMGINSGAYVAEVIRAGILSIDHGQMEAGRSLGLSKGATLVYIIIPQAIKNILPALANEFIVLIKETAIVGYIAVEDLTKVGQIIMSRTMNVTPLFVTAGMYFIMISILTFLLRIFEKKIRTSDKR